MLNVSSGKTVTIFCSGIISMSLSIQVCFPPYEAPGSLRALPRKKIDLDHPRMELRYLREIHAERPHCFQRRVDDDFLLGSERWLQNLASKSIGARMN